MRGDMTLAQAVAGGALALAEQLSGLGLPPEDIVTHLLGVYVNLGTADATYLASIIPDALAAAARIGQLPPGAPGEEAAPPQLPGIEPGEINLDIRTVWIDPSTGMEHDDPIRVVVPGTFDKEAIDQAIQDAWTAQIGVHYNTDWGAANVEIRSVYATQGSP